MGHTVLQHRMIRVLDTKRRAAVCLSRTQGQSCIAGVAKWPCTILLTSSNITNIQAGIVVADNLTDKAADLICKELGFLHVVDWVDVLDLDGISVYYGFNLDLKMRNYLVLSRTLQANISLNVFITHIKLFDIYCGNEAEKFDRDCSYSLSVYSNNTFLSYVHPFVILSCNPSPGN